MESEFTENGFDFEVEKKLIFIVGSSGENVELNNRKAIINSSNNACLGVVADQYNLFNNQRFTELSYKIQKELGLAISHFQSYKDGRKVLTAFKNDENKSFKLLDFEFSNNLILVDARDKTACLGLSGVGTLYRCDNMFTSFRQDKKSFKIRHNSNLDVMVADLSQALEMYGVQQKLYLDRLEQLSEIKVDQKNMHDFLADWVLLESDQVKQIAEGKTLEGISTNKKNIIDGIINSWNTESGDLGKNGFAAWNTVTHFFTHKKKQSENQLLFANFGKKENDIIQFVEALN